MNVNTERDDTSKMHINSDQSAPLGLFSRHGMNIDDIIERGGFPALVIAGYLWLNDRTWFVPVLAVLSGGLGFYVGVSL